MSGEAKQSKGKLIIGWILLLYLSLFSSGLGLIWLYFNWQEIGSFWSAFIVGIVLGSLYFIGKKNVQK